MFKYRVLAGILAASFIAAGSAHAGSGNAYYVVVPVKGKAAAGPVVPAITVSLASSVLHQAMAGQPYKGVNLNTFLTVTGDPAFTGAGVTWVLASGSLPAGLTLTSDGAINGTPIAGGTSAFRVRASYKTKAGENAYELFVGSISVALASATAPQAVVGQVYSYDLKANLSVTGDQAYTGSGVTWAVVSSTLPTGLTLRADGTITGTPVAAGSGVITVRATYRGTNGQESYQVVAKAVKAVLQVSPGPDIRFAKTAVGKATRIERTVTNAGDGVASALVAAPPRGFTVNKSGCPSSLPAGESCTLVINFQPDEPRSYSGEIVVSSGNGGWTTIPVYGTGLAGPSYTESHFYAGFYSGIGYLYNEGPDALTITDCKRTPAGGGAAVSCTSKDVWPAIWANGMALQGVVISDTYYVSLSNGQKVAWQPQSMTISMQ